MELLTGIEYVKCMAICAYDKKYEKLNWSTRLEGFDNLDLTDTSKLYDTAYNPVGLKAALLAYKNAINSVPSGYMISLDGSASGLQLLGIAMRCVKSLMLCGLNPDKCADAYQDIYKIMLTYDEIDKDITKAQLKQAIMPALYGSNAEPKKLFGEDNLDLFDSVMNEAVPKAWELNKILQQVWNMLLPSQSSYEWTLPDGFECSISTFITSYTEVEFLGTTQTIQKKVIGKPEFDKSLAPNIVHSFDGYIVREMLRRCMFDQVEYLRACNAMQNMEPLNPNYKLTNKDHKMMKYWSMYISTGILSAKIIPYIDVNNAALIGKPEVVIDLLMSMPDKPFELVTVHDCFRCLPNYGNIVRQQYNIILDELNRSNLMESVLSEIIGQPVDLELDDPIDSEALLHANYTLT